MEMTNTSIKAGLRSLCGRLLTARERFMAFWLVPPLSIVSIAVAETGDTAIVELTPVGERYIATARELHLRSTEPRDIAEEIALDLARAGWESVPRVLVVPEQFAQSFIHHLPPDMSAAEAYQAAYWETVDEYGISEEENMLVGAPLTGSDYYISAVVRDFIQDYTAAFGAAECELSNIVLGAPSAAELTRLAGELLVEWQLEEVAGHSPIYKEALYGALRYLAPPPPAPASYTLLERQEAEHYSYPRIGAAIIVATFIALLLASLVELYSLHGIKAENEQVQHELALHSPDLKQMRLLEQVKRDTAQKEQILTQLTAENISWYGIMVHFGTLTIDGVYLDRITFVDKNTLRLEGHAVTYEALAEFLAKFEQDKDFFPHGPLLQNTTTEEQGLSFTVTLEL